MLVTTQGLVLHTTKYAETSIVAKIFTRELGLRSYIVKGIRSASGRTKQNLMQPLSHLEMTVYDNPKKQLQYIKEMHPARHYAAINSDSIRMALVFFMDEVLYKSLKEEEPNRNLFDYVVEELQRLGGTELTDIEEPQPKPNRQQHYSTFPIHFLLRTARYIGIEPMDNYSTKEPMFNLKEGRFQSMPNGYSATLPDSDYYLDMTSSSHLHSCLTSTHRSEQMPQLTAKQRSATLNNLLEYYQVHLTDFKNFKSHEVLHAVLR